MQRPNRLKKFLFIILGTLSLGVGILAIFIPGVPTTPFLLLAAWLYLKSSKRLYDKLMANRIVGGYIREFQSNRGMTVRTKLQAIGTMWLMIGISCTFMVDSVPIRLVIIAVGIVGTIVMGFIVRTADRNDRKDGS
jgi:hypothetical protein